VRRHRLQRHRRDQSSRRDRDAQRSRRRLRRARGRGLAAVRAVPDYDMDCRIRARLHTICDAALYRAT
jgi:hypothetical protein